MITSNPEIQIEVERLAAILRGLPIRATATYAELSETVGYPVNRKPFALLKARKLVEQETGMRFATVRREGVKKLDGADVVGIGAMARKLIARKARTQAARLTGLSYNDIDSGKQARIDAERSLLGAISATAKADIERVTQVASTGPVVAAKVFDLLNKAA